MTPFINLFLFLVVMSWIGSISKNLSIKKGLNGTLGYWLGFLLSFFGLGLVYLIPKKNNFQFKNSLLVRLLFGIGRLIILFIILFFYIFREKIFYTNIDPLDGLLIVHIFVVGGLWVVRGIGEYKKTL